MEYFTWFTKCETAATRLIFTAADPRRSGASPDMNETAIGIDRPVPWHASSSESVVCFHCEQPVGEASWHLVLSGVRRTFCCSGCMGVAQVIHEAGLDAFYMRRSALPDAARASGDVQDDYGVAAEAGNLIRHIGGDLREASLLLEGIHCAACVWLNEAYLRRHPGVMDVEVNFVTRRARVRWDARKTKLSDLLRAVQAIGYRAYPYDPARREALAQRENRALMARTALALLAMMQVMMLALPGYVSVDGVESEYRSLLNWASLMITTPAVFYCAAPFFAGALRDIRLRRLGMDVPVALGIGGAFGASAWSTLNGIGTVYFDSVTMFVALLLVARFIELRVRQRAGDAVEAIARDLPDVADRLPRYPASLVPETVPVAALRAGDCIRVATGASIPADGEVIEGRSSVEEAILTGESWPRTKAPGDTVLAGSINRESPLVVRVLAAGEATSLAALGRMVERAAAERPRVARLADHIAGWFVAVLVLLAMDTGLAWLYLDPGRALAVTLAVLVVSCPCALSLATPAVLAAAAAALARRGIFAMRGDALEAMARVTHVVLDKTGTLTQGRLQLTHVQLLGAHDRATCIGLAAALEHGSEHPVARALRAAAAPAAHIAAQDVVVTPGSGVEGHIGGCRYRVGRLDWVSALHGNLPFTAGLPSEAIVVALADDSDWIAAFWFSDMLRPGARGLVAKLRAIGIEVSILSGDREATVQRVAETLGVADYRAEARPDGKRSRIADLQRNGAIVAMVGDGINDAPGLAQADVSLSLGSAAELTRWTADVVVLGDDLPRIAEAITRARQAFRVIRQNLAWAFAYNLIAIPLAATGHVTPLVAALGMSISSILVLGNALRLLRADREWAGLVTGDSVSADLAPVC